nr:hypothetical protein HK105_001596 [Polyrhizophydium stewartii]
MQQAGAYAVRACGGRAFVAASAAQLPVSVRAYSSYPSPQAVAPVTGSDRKKVTITTLRKLHREGTPITVMTAHDYATGVLVERAGFDICLVGDSLAMVALGYDSTNKIKFEEMMHHSRAVARGSKCAFLVGDMPFGTYEASPEDAVRNAIRYMHEGDVEAVKLEGGAEIQETIRRITSVGVPVMGHIGLTPQRQASLGGFKVQGKTLERAQQLLKDALALQDAGCFSIVLEAVPHPVATFITKQLSVPTIGIGAGPQTSGQVLVMMDALGIYDRLSPKFSNVYAAVGEIANDGLRRYIEEVRARKFPAVGVNTYKMSPGEEERFIEWSASYEAAKTTTRYQVHWKAEVSGVTSIGPADKSKYDWRFKVRARPFTCTKCREAADSVVNINAEETVEMPNSKGTTNLLMRCKFCKNEGSVDIELNTVRNYSIDDSEKFAPLVVLEGRGWEPTEWVPSVARAADDEDQEGFKAEGADSGTKFEDID